MSILDRLLFREVFKTLAVILTVLILVLLANNIVKLLGQVASGVLSAEVLGMLIGLQTLKLLTQVVPPAFFFAILWVLGRMYRDSEMVALQSSGVGIARIYRTLLIISVPLVVIVSLLVMVTLPWAKTQIDRIKVEQRETADITGVRAGRFNEFRRGELMIYAGKLSLDGFKLEQVVVQDRQQGELGIVTAEHAYQTTDPASGDRFIILANGRRYQGTPGQGDFSIGEFDEYAVRLPRFTASLTDIPTDARPTAELWKSDDIVDRTEFQSRLALPLAVMVFAVLSIPMARSGPRQDMYGRVGLAVLIYFTFINLLRVAEKWMLEGVTPAWMGTWWVLLVMLLIGGIIVLLDSQWLAGRQRHRRMRKANAAL